MNEEQPSQEKDFRCLISQFTKYSESRDKMIFEIDDILDRIKLNRRPTVEEKQNSNELAAQTPVIITQLRDLINQVDLSNEKLNAIIQRLNELA